MRDPYLFVIRHGPFYNLDALVHFGATLGRRFSGEIHTFGDEPWDHEVGPFRIRRSAVSEGGWIKRLAYLSRVLGRALALRWIHGKRLVVITYDPLMSGAIGLLVKWLTGARFICEVNGVYGHPDTLIDIEDSEVRAMRRERMLCLGAFVLRRANAIKLLFPGQLEGFYHHETPRRFSFFEAVVEWKFAFRDVEPSNLLLFIGHPFLLKGVDLLIEGFSRLKPDFPDWSLVVIGWGIEDPARQHGPSLNGVTFLGPQSQVACSEWLEKSKALVLPSRSEAMGRVLLEAAFKGRARIASRVGGIPTVVEDGVDGLLFEPGSVDDLERQLRRFISDSKLQKRLGEAALNRARREFSSSQYLRRYIEVISHVTGKVASEVMQEGVDNLGNHFRVGDGECSG